MKHQGTKLRHWLPFLFISGFFILFSIFFYPYCSTAARTRPYTIDGFSHDFPYESCTLTAIDADVRDVLQAFADKYKLNLIMSEDVKGTISIIINNISAKEAFKNILRYSDLGYTKEENVYRIKTIEKLLKEEALKQKTEDLTTEIIPLKYANAERLLKNLSKFKSNVPGAIIDADKWTNSLIIKDTPRKIKEITDIISYLDVSSPAKEIKELEKSTTIIKLQYINCQDVARIKTLRGKISTHPQTNSVIITDVPQNIPHLTLIIQDLDKPIRQVLIEAKIVETKKRYLKNLGIQWGGYYATRARGTAGGKFPTVIVGGGLGGNNYAVNLPTSEEALGNLNFILGHVEDKVLNLRLSAM